MNDNLLPGIILDEEQKQAVTCMDQNQLIIAGAGAGKTMVMVAKVKYLVTKYKVDPATIMIISYTNKAVKELQERLSSLDIKTNVSTFHKLANQVLKANHIRRHLVDNKKLIIDAYFASLVDNRAMLLKLKYYFGYYLEIPKAALIFNSPSQYNQFISNIEYLTLSGVVNRYNQTHLDIVNDMVANPSELIVANYLYLNGFSYQYKSPLPIKIRSNYTPLFTVMIANKLTCLEIKSNTIYDIKVIKLLDIYHVPLIMLRSDNLLVDLDYYLGNYAQKATTYDLFMDIKKVQALSVYQKLVALIINFIDALKTTNRDINQLKPTNKRDALFLELVKPVYEYYEAYLVSHDLIDYDDMIKVASDLKLTTNYQYIMVDEYQDISQMRFTFLESIKGQSSLIVVGDDFQAIFAFAGSSIKLFFDFEKQLNNTKTLKITTTYRNSQELITTAGAFVMKNKHQIHKRLKSIKHLKRPIKIYLYQDEDYLDRIRRLEAIIASLDSPILLLGRYRFDLDHYLHDSYFKKTADQIICLKYPDKIITFLTIHMAKGLGFNNVVLLNMEDGLYGFPSQKRSDPVMNMVKPIDDDYLYAEERRLFYTALTRTKNYVYLLVPIHNASPFAFELAVNREVEIINQTGERYHERPLTCPHCHYPLVRDYYNNKHIQPLYRCTNDKNVCGFETNNLRFMMKVKKCFRCQTGYLVIKKRRDGFYLECTNGDFRKMLK